MKITLRGKDHSKRVGPDNAGEILASFIPGKELEDVIQHKIDGATTQYDECYLDKRMRSDEGARKWVELMQERHPEADLTPKCIKRRWRKRFLMACMLLSLIVVAYAWLYQPEKQPASEEEYYGFSGDRIKDVLDSAQKVYRTRIILDHPEIGDKPCSGSMDPAMPVEEFLKKFSATNGVEYISDSAAVFHVRKAPSGNSSRN